MSRKIHAPFIDRNSLALSISKGGHSGITAAEGATNLNLVTPAVLDQPSGVAATDADNYLAAGVVPAFNDVLDIVNVTGPTTISVNQVVTYTITDYESFKNYVITTIGGTAVRNGDTITYTGPSSLVPASMTINGRQINILVSALGTVTTPQITSPTNNETGVAKTFQATSNQFSMQTGVATHQASDWQLASDAAFTNIINQVTASTNYLTSWLIAGLADSATYYLRVRYLTNNGLYSNWSTPVAFTSVSINAVTQPSILSPVNLATNQNLVVNFTSNPFDTIGSGDTHEGSDWQLSSNAGFTSIVSSVTNSAINKLTWSVNGLSGGSTYYARVRYKGQALGYSQWSSVISFTTSLQLSYSVSANSSYNEGNTVNVSISTVNVANGTTLYWTIEGTNVDSSDFTNNISGSVVINNNVGSVSRTLANDAAIEGSESFVFKLRSGSISGTVLATSQSITITDTSIYTNNTAPVLSNFNNNVTYTHPTPVTLVATGTISDAELDGTNWNGAKLAFDSDVTTSVFSALAPLAFDVENISGVNTNTVRYSGGLIGTWETDVSFIPLNGPLSDNIDLLITFNSSVTASIVENVLKHIQYENTVDNVNKGSNISIIIKLYDGNTGAQGSGGALSVSKTMYLYVPYVLNGLISYSGVVTSMGGNNLGIQNGQNVTFYCNADPTPVNSSVETTFTWRDPSNAVIRQVTSTPLEDEMYPYTLYSEDILPLSINPSSAGNYSITIDRDGSISDVVNFTIIVT